MKPDYAFGPIPDWVKPPFDNTNEEIDLENHDWGTVYPYFDHQVNATSRELAEYTHYKEKVITPAGTRSASELRLLFSPKNQHIVLHDFIIWRNEKRINKNKTAHFKVEQTERVQGGDKYLGYKALTVMLDDVQVGDTIEASYTIHGSDPATANHIVLWRNAALKSFMVPRRQILILPEDKEIYWRNFKTNIEPVIQSETNGKSYTWIIPHQEPEFYEEYLPSWFELDPHLEISDLKNWSEVIDIVEPYYRLPKSIPTELKTRVSDIQSQFSDIEQQVNQCLLYVQNEVRYLSLDEPHLTYSPNTLTDIIQNGFGDCKDKSYLLVTMLRMLGVEAHTALICFSSPYIPAEALPSMKVFDHIIVYMVVNDIPYWVDATSVSPVTNLRNRGQMNYGDSLILKPGNNKLDRLPEETRCLLDIEETFDLTSGLKGPYPFNIVNTYYYAAADNYRYRLNTNSIKTLSDEFHDFFKRGFKNIDMVNPIEVIDDVENNVLILKEFYSIPHLDDFEQYEDQLVFRPTNVLYNLKEPPTPTRKLPLVLPHPIHTKQKVRILLSKLRHKFIRPETNITTAQYLYRAEGFDKDNVIERSFEYQSFKDHILPEELSDYAEQTDKAIFNTIFLVPKNVLKSSWFSSFSDNIWYYLGIAAIGKIILSFFK